MTPNDKKTLIQNAAANILAFTGFALFMGLILAALIVTTAEPAAGQDKTTCKENESLFLVPQEASVKVVPRAHKGDEHFLFTGQISIIAKAPPCEIFTLVLEQEYKMVDPQTGKFVRQQPAKHCINFKEMQYSFNEKVPVKALYSGPYTQVGESSVYAGCHQ